jgi:hypothetical protein
MKNDIELKMRILEKFGIMSEPKSIEFCKEAYKFIYGNTTGTTGEGPADIVANPVAVDLGLPSGTKWADRNIGALNPEDTGLYFSWGNTVGHEAGKDYDLEDDYDNTQGSELKEDIDLEHDAARVNLGEPWKMPTKEQFKELVDNCESEVTTINGYLGRRFTSKINGNSIFMPFAGYISGTGLSRRGSSGSYWSSSLGSQTGGCDLYFISGGVSPAGYDDRFYGFSVRAVQ